LSHNRSLEEAVKTIHQLKDAKELLHVDYMNKQFAKATTAVGNYCVDSFENAFRTFSPQMRETLIRTLSSSSSLPDPEKDAFRHSVFGVALGVSNDAKRTNDLVRNIAPRYHYPNNDSDGPITKENARFRAAQDTLIAGAQRGQEAAKGNPNSPDVAFRQGLLAMANAVRGKRPGGGDILSTNEAIPGPVVAAEPWLGWFGSYRLKKAPEGVAEALERAANQKVNLLVPAPQRAEQSDLPDTRVRETNVGLSPAQEQRYSLQAAHAPSNQDLRSQMVR
jgi:hypothetical protein